MTTAPDADERLERLVELKQAQTLAYAALIAGDEDAAEAVDSIERQRHTLLNERTHLATHEN
jgi:hypothetical protein